jgi:hypothetical protein
VSYVLHSMRLPVFEQLLFRIGFGRLPAENDFRYFKRRITQ